MRYFEMKNLKKKKRFYNYIIKGIIKLNIFYEFVKKGD